MDYRLLFLLLAPSTLRAEILPTGLYQVLGEDGRLSIMEAGGLVRKALLADGTSVQVLRITVNKDKSLSFRDSKGVELFASTDSPFQRLPRLRYSYAPIPEEGVLTHRGFVVSGRAFRSLQGDDPLRTDLDALPSAYARLSASGGYWIETYYDQKALGACEGEASPFTGLLGQISYRALPLEGNLWAVLSEVSGGNRPSPLARSGRGNSGSFSQMAVFKKEGSVLIRTALLAEGDRGFGGVTGMAVAGRTLTYTRSLNEVPPSWPGLYARAMDVALEVSGAGSSLGGIFRYEMGGSPKLVEIRLTRNLYEEEEPHKMLAKAGAAFKTPRDFQNFLRGLMPEAVKRAAPLTNI